ncbi:MAG: aminotransferase class I/II-fold pyridoxal phosphate-dependent enzyme [Spirulina sp. SIO3F2]|nr:aminotransferase class I/II-fold pyridoxal phosphate-dependent enzyme [Spirulina sp. SIO3F2]
MLGSISSRLSVIEPYPIFLRKLQAIAQRPHAPFYTPGHRRGRGASAALRDLLGMAALRADVPELPELGNLFATEGAIADAQTLAAQTFGAENTWFLVNGSTCGIIAAILATCGTGDKIIVPRNLHQSVISGLILAGADPVFVQPPYNAQRDIAYGVTPEAIAAALASHPEAKAVLVVYPTYQGVCSDLGAIAQLVHAHNLPLIVDEAHGAHFAFHPELPPSALSLGADIAVQSTHKTLGALTQAAMLHHQGDRVTPQRLSRALQWVQSTSPNYLLLASLEAATVQMAEQGNALMTQTLALAHCAREVLTSLTPLTKGGRGDYNSLQLSVDSSQKFLPLTKGGWRDCGISILQPPSSLQPGFAALDPTRLTVFTRGLGQNGFDLDVQLHEQLGVTAELPLEYHLTFIISLGSTDEDITQLIQAWQHLVNAAPENPAIAPLALPPLPLPPLVCSPRQACFAPTKTRSLAEAIGEVCAAIVCPYPPGIPVLMPGERVTGEAIAYLQKIQQLGGEITGLDSNGALQIMASSDSR